MVKKIIGQTYIWLILLLMYLPVLIIIAYSFTTQTNIGPWTDVDGVTHLFKDTTGQLYVDLFNDAKIMTAVGNTLIIAVISALVSVVLGTTGAIGAFYLNKKARKSFDLVTQIPIVNAEIVIALSLTVMFVFCSTYLFKTNLMSFWTLVIGHVVLSVPFVYISVKPKLEQMDPSLYEAAIDLGATPHKALWKVIIPETTPGILSGFLLAITLSLDDFIVTRFTRGPGLLSGEASIETISTLVQAAIKKGPIPTPLRALTTIIFGIVLLVVIVISVQRYVKDKRLATRRLREHV